MAVVDLSGPVRLNLTEVDDKPVAEGWYHVMVVSAEAKLSKKDMPQINVMGRIQDEDSPEFNKALFWYLTFDTDRQSFNIKQIKRFVAACPTIDPDLNYPSYKDFADALVDLVARLKAEQQILADKHGKYVPIALKIAPDMEAGQIAQIARLLVQHRIDGVIATNTTLSRQGVEHLPHGAESGGLSGAPLREKSTAVVRQLAADLQDAVPIIGVGGILNGADAAAKISSGASLVQLYSGLIYRGPELVKESCAAIRAA